MPAAQRQQQPDGALGIPVAAGRRVDVVADVAGEKLDFAGVSDADDVAFFPLTMPLTTGPGTIAVAIALDRSLAAVDLTSGRPTMSSQAERATPARRGGGSPEAGC